MTPIKTQILARVKTLLDALKTAAVVRKVERVTSPFLLETTTPALHIYVGPENQIEQDNFGYVMEFPLVLRCIFAEERDPYSKGDELEAQAQKTIEADPQLNQLACLLRYEGDDPYVNEIDKPSGGVYVHYTVQYRRKKADPETNY